MSLDNFFKGTDTPRWRRKALIALTPSSKWAWLCLPVEDLERCCESSNQCSYAQKGQIEMGKHQAFDELCATLNHLHITCAPAQNCHQD